MNYLKTIRVGFVLLVVFFAAALLFTLLTSFAASGDPETPYIMITAVPPIHQADMGYDIYFNNSNGGQITAVVWLSGTPPLTFTSAPAFNRAGEQYTDTTNPAFPVLRYSITSGDGSQLGITYTVVNSYSASATTLVNYIRDITPTVSTITTTYGVITAAAISPLLLAGAVSDAGSGIQEVEINPAGMGYIAAALGNTGNHITHTTWSYNWPIPTADRVGYALLYRGRDNLDLTELAHTTVITVDNMAPEPMTPTITVHGANLHITWPASTAPDTAGYRLTLYDGNNNPLLTTNQTGTSYNYVGVVGQVYYVRLRVYDDVGNLSTTERESNHVLAGRFIFLPLLFNP